MNKPWLKATQKEIKNITNNQARYKIRNHIRQRQSEQKGAVKDIQSMVKG